MQKRKCLILGIVLILCLSLFACTNSDDTIYSDNNTNQIEDGYSEQLETTNTPAPDENSNIIGAWQSLDYEDSFFIFNGDNTAYMIALGENKSWGAVTKLITYTYDVNGNTCTLKLKEADDVIVDEDESDSEVTMVPFSRSEDILTFEELDGEKLSFKLINDTDDNLLPGEWISANGSEFHVEIGNWGCSPEHITFYNDGSVKIGDFTDGRYAIVFDGEAIHFSNIDGYREETVPIRMLGCGMMLFNEADNYYGQHLLTRTSPNCFQNK